MDASIPRIKKGHTSSTSAKEAGDKKTAAIRKGLAISLVSGNMHHGARRHGRREKTAKRHRSKRARRSSRAPLQSNPDANSLASANVVGFRHARGARVGARKVSVLQIVPVARTTPSRTRSSRIQFGASSIWGLG